MMGILTVLAATNRRSPLCENGSPAAETTDTPTTAPACSAWAMTSVTRAQLDGRVIADIS